MRRTLSKMSQDKTYSRLGTIWTDRRTELVKQYRALHSDAR